MTPLDKRDHTLEFGEIRPRAPVAIAVFNVNLGGMTVEQRGPRLLRQALPRRFHGDVEFLAHRLQ